MRRVAIRDTAARMVTTGTTGSITCLLASGAGCGMVAPVNRVPILIVILLSAVAIGAPWYIGTRHMDFMTPPSAEELARVRAETAMSVAKKSGLFSIEEERNVKAVVESPIRAAPVIDPGEPDAPAPLSAYGEHAAEGAAAFITLAVHLEEQRGNSRALLAWERVIDVCQADPAQRDAALAGIRRLRPLVAVWNSDPEVALPVVLEASVPSNVQADALEEVLTKCAHELGRHSSGLIKFEPRVERPERKGEASPILSLQMTADGSGAASTGQLDFELPTEPDSLRRELLSGAYKLVASQLAATTVFNPPDPLSSDENPSQALETKITRLCWSEFGKSLQPAHRP